MKDPNFKFYQFLVSKLVKFPKTVNWGKEIKLAKKLLELFPDKKAWSEFFIDTPDKPVTLTWYLTPEGKSFLHVEHKKTKLLLKEKSKEHVKDNDIKKPEVKRKVKTTLDFLKQKL